MSARKKMLERLIEKQALDPNGFKHEFKIDLDDPKSNEEIMRDAIEDLLRDL